MADKELPDRKETTERRVYNLPPDLLERLRAYQLSQGISSEVEAARRLLHTALQMRDTAKDILNTLAAKYTDEKDLRILAGDVLSKHILVSHINFTERGVSFTLKGGESGLIEENGTLYYSHSGAHEDDWTHYRRKESETKGRPSWDDDKGGDLDDEIPF